MFVFLFNHFGKKLKFYLCFQITFILPLFHGNSKAGTFEWNWAVQGQIGSFRWFKVVEIAVATDLTAEVLIFVSRIVTCLTQKNANPRSGGWSCCRIISHMLFQNRRLPNCSSFSKLKNIYWRTRFNQLFKIAQTLFFVGMFREFYIAHRVMTSFSFFQFLA